MSYTDDGSGFGSGYSIGSKWGWFLALGVLITLLGIYAMVNVVMATIASIYFIAAVMVVAGAGYLVHAFQVRGWENVLYWALGGVLYLIAGIFAFMNPIAASAVLTLVMAVTLIVAGIARLVIGLRMRGSGGTYMILSGIVTALGGVLIAAGWPASSLFVLGLFLSVDLIIQGATLIGLSLALRRLA